jgi:uncharacterized protein with PIN domain
VRTKKGQHDIGRPPQTETTSNLNQAPVRGLEVMKDGRIRPLSYYNGKGLADVRWVSGRFLLSLQEIWEEMGDDILRRVAASHPELLLMAMCKIAAVQRIEVGQPDDFSGLKSKAEIVDKLEERAGPEARKLFESFIKKVEAPSRMERARTAAEIAEQAQEQQALLGSGRTDAAAKARLNDTDTALHGFVRRCSAALFKIAEGRHHPLSGAPAGREGGRPRRVKRGTGRSGGPAGELVPAGAIERRASGLGYGPDGAGFGDRPSRSSRRSEHIVSLGSLIRQSVKSARFRVRPIRRSRHPMQSQRPPGGPTYSSSKPNGANVGGGGRHVLQA